MDIDAAFTEVVDGLTDNARNNGVAINDGWTAESAVAAYVAEADILALPPADYRALEARVAAFLAG